MVWQSSEGEEGSGSSGIASIPTVLRDQCFPDDSGAGRRLGKPGRPGAQHTFSLPARSFIQASLSSLHYCPPGSAVLSPRSLSGLSFQVFVFSIFSNSSDFQSLLVLISLQTEDPGLSHRSSYSLLHPQKLQSLSVQVSSEITTARQRRGM